jgi:homoserine kinase type II
MIRGLALLTFYKTIMSVFTTLSLEEVREFLCDFDLGEITELRGIAAGITNTNYFVVTANNRYVLTIFEKNKLEELGYFADLMTFLAQKDVLCPLPIADKNGLCLHLLKGKPAMMVSCLNGTDILAPTIHQVEQVAYALAHMHVKGANFKQADINQRDKAWRVATAQKVLPKLAKDDQVLLQAELDYLHGLNLSALPHGVIHGDLFRDNVLFDGDNLGGFIDFYYACQDVLAYDVAIAVNEWCVHHNGADIGELDQEKVTAFLRAYQQIRSFSSKENAAWHDLCRLAALRFWLSRLHDFYFPQAGELTHTKDPNHFKHIMQQWIVTAQAAKD